MEEEKKDTIRLCLNLPLIKREMARKRMSKRDLASKINKDPHAISRYFKEPDKVRFNTACDIAKALSMELDVTYENLIVYVDSDEKYKRIISDGRGYGKGRKKRNDRS